MNIFPIGTLCNKLQSQSEHLYYGNTMCRILRSSYVKSVFSKVIVSSIINDIQMSTLLCTSQLHIYYYFDPILGFPYDNAIILRV